MKRLFQAMLAMALPVFVTACLDDDDSDPVASTAELSIIHASADAPAVDLELNGQSIASNVDFKQVWPNQLVSSGSAEITVRGILPGGARPTVIGPARVALEPQRRYAVLAVGNAASIQPLVITREASAVPAGSVRLQVVHAAPAAPRVSVYVTALNANLAASAPAGTFSFRESFGPATVPAGEYQIRVTPAGTPGTVVFDSGPVRLDAGADLLIAAVPNTTTGAAPITLLATTPQGGRIELLDRATPAALRVVHASPDAPAVDVVVNDNFAQPLVPRLAFPNFTGFVQVPPATYNVKVTPAGNPGVIAINANLALARGVEYSVFAVGRLAAIEPLVLTDNRRRVATQAKVRILHASPTAGAVDLYVLAPGAALATATPAFTNVPFKADTGYVSLAGGSYDVVVTPTGSRTPAIGPARITVGNGGVYTIAARDAVGGGVPLGVILLDDFAP
jgi:hypothetical protein